MDKKNFVYRPDVDGLRSLAIILVLAYHAFPAVISGGFIGVDIFFVISGYLITSVIWHESRDGRFSYRTFYFRRIRRLFPVLIIVSATSLVIGWQVLTGEEYKQLAKHTIAGLAFVSNLNLWTEFGYFDSTADLKPLLHLWSLGVEEQFYLVWPALALLWGPRLTKSPKLVYATLAALLLLCGVIATASNESAFYLPFARFWELFVGAALSLNETHARARPKLCPFLGLGISTLTPNAIAAFGAGLVLIPAFTMQHGAAFPFPAAIFPTSGAALLLSTKTSFLNLRVLSSRPCVGIGLISYALYMWHWPLLSFLRIEFNGTPPVGWRLGAIVLAIGLSIISYGFVERWFRNKGRGRLKLGIIAVSSVLIVIAASNIYARDGLGFRIDGLLKEAIGKKDDHYVQWRSGRCFIDQEDSETFASDCIGSKDRPDVLLWGDSHAAALYPGMADAAAHNVSIAQFTGALCKPLLGDQRLSPMCRKNNSLVLQAIEKHQPRLVVLHARWEGEKDTYSMERTVAKLREIGIENIALIGPSPTWTNDLPRLVFSYYRKHHAVPPQWSTECNFQSIVESDTIFENIASKNSLGYVSFAGVLYSSSGCPIRTAEFSKDIMMFDADHLTVAGSLFVAPHIWSQLKKYGPST